MKKKWLKKGSAVLLAAAMVLSLFPGMKGTLATVKAADNTAPTSGYFTDAAGLKGYSLSDSSTTIGKIRFGADNRLWAICGAYGDNLALLSTSEFAQAAYGSTSKYSNSNFVTNIDTYLSSTYFSRGELGKMAAVTVSTNEPNGSGGNTEVPVADKKLYLPNSQDQNSYGQTTIYVGSGNDIAIDVTKLDDVGHTNHFWLRSPYDDYSNIALVAYPGSRVRSHLVDDDGVSVVPAFNLNLSSDIFASAAEAASSSYRGYKANSEMTENTFTLRYTYTDGTDSAVINPSGTQVKVTNANNKYLMIQNNVGVYALAIDSDSKTVNASDITMGSALDNFKNCKVWIESTDAERITTAKMAKWAAAMAETPTFAPAGGTYTENQLVTLTTSTDGATIYYTTDGTEPTTDSNVYSGAISVTGTAGQSISTTIKAIAVKSGMPTSNVASANYVIELPAPAPNDGKVTIDTPQIGQGAPDTTMNNSVEDLKNKVLTDTEKALVTGGEDAKVYIEVKDASSTVSAADKEKVEAALGSNTLGIYLDVSLWVKVGNNDARKVTDPSGTISVSIKMPENLINKDAAVTRTYKIVRVHNGVPTVIEGTYDAATGYFTFETDAFSTYALSYSDKTLDNNSGNNNNTPQNTTQTVAQNTTQSAAQTAPKTGDNTPILPLALLLLCMGLVNIGVIYKKRYKTTGR